MLTPETILMVLYAVQIRLDTSRDEWYVELDKMIQEEKSRQAAREGLKG